MSEFAPASPWKAMVLLAVLPRLVRPFAISSIPWTRALRLLSAGCFARRITHVTRPPKSEKPRKIRHLRRSAARARGRDQILLTALRACYSNVRNLGRFGI